MEVTPPLHLPIIDASGTVPDDQVASTLAYIQNIDLESYESLNGMPADGDLNSVNSWLRIADDCVRIYELGDIDGETTVYSNDIQNAVIAITDRQSREPVQSSIDPISSGDKPAVFWIGPDAAAAQIGIDPVFAHGTFDPQSGAQLSAPPLPDSITQQLPPQLLQNDQFFASVNADLMADYYQSLYDATWQRSRLDQWFRSNTLRTNIVGWQFDLYEFDHATKKVMMTELSVHQVRVDPTVSTLDKAAYAGVWLLVDQTWAMRKYPKLVGMIDPATGNNIIEQESRLGNPLPYGASSDPLAEYMSVNFRRKMLVMQLWWFRNQYVKLTPQEAIDSGQIVQAEIPVQPETDDLTETGQPIGDSQEEQPNDNPMVQDGADGGESGLPDDHSDSGTADANGVLGGGTLGQSDQSDSFLPADQAGQGTMGSGIPAPPPPTRPALIHPQTGKEIDPTHDQWPVRLGLGRMIVINNHVAEWVEEDAWDIPLVHNVCIPVPRKPWGIGEPYRLLNMQRAYNRTWGSMVDHCDWNAHPPVVMSQSMHAATSEIYKDAKVKPGATIIVDDQVLAANNGKLDLIQDLPQMAAHLPEMELRMSTKLSESAGNSDVQQGFVQTSQARSGKAIEMLQMAGDSTNSFKAQSGGDMVYRLDRLILHDIYRSFGVEDAMKVNSRYPANVVAYILEQGPQTEMDFEVSIAGGGTTAQAKRQRDQNDLQIGAISMETYRDRNGLDHQQEKQRIAEQQQGQQQDKPVESINFKDTPPQAQSQMLQQAGIQVSPQDLQAHQQQQQQQQANAKQNGNGRPNRTSQPQGAPNA